ncbi:MAG: caspase family protein [Spirochaetales bacterium]|nr:caspase family protein [Spirochaetales bacterium]
MQKSVCLYLFLFISFTVSSLLYAEPRHALLIANGEYKHFAGLANPVGEADMLAKSLRQLGFEVTIKQNLSMEQMKDALFIFEETVKQSGGIAFFHYGGHAVQVKGENYLIPTDADIPDERRVDTRALNLDEVMDSMCGEINIVILDACRNNPLPSGEGRSASRGLLPITHKPQNSVIVYSAQAGAVAQDGVFTPIMADKILEPKSFSKIIRDVRVAVKEKTVNMQIPGCYDDSDNDIFLAGIVMSDEQKKLENSRKEYDDLEKEIADIKARINEKRNEKENELSMLELQKKEAAAKQKKIELEQQQELENRRQAMIKRQKEIQSEYEQNQQEQELQFIKVQQANAEKQKLLQQLQKDAISIDDIMDSNDKLQNAINEVASNYNNARDKALSQITSFYKQKFDEIVNMKKEKWERPEEFTERQNVERTTYSDNEKEELEQINQRYNNEIKESTKELKRQLKENAQKIITVTKDVNVLFGEYNDVGEFFPASVSYNGKYVSIDDSFEISIKSDNVAERRGKGIEIENKIKSNGYVGEIEQCLSDGKAMIRKYRIIDISDNSVLFEKEVNKIGTNVQIQKKYEAAEKYKKHTYAYGSLIGIGSGIGAVSLTLIPVGAANMADCYERRLDYGVGVSVAILGVGFGTAVVSAIMLSVTSVIWYRDISANGIRWQIKRYNSSRMTVKQKTIATLSTLAPNVLCGDGIIEVGMRIRL